MIHSFEVREGRGFMILGCTQKAAKIIAKQLQVEYQEEPSLYCWHVMMFEVQHDQFLLFMNEATRFPLFMNTKVLEEQDVETSFTSMFREVMRYLRIPNVAVESYLENFTMQYTKAYNRSILTQMSELAYVYKANVLHGSQKWYRDVDASIDYARIPCLKLHMYPNDRMHEEMMQIYGKLIGAL